MGNAVWAAKSITVVKNGNTLNPIKPAAKYTIQNLFSSNPNHIAANAKKLITKSIWHFNLYFSFKIKPANTHPIRPKTFAITKI